MNYFELYDIPESFEIDQAALKRKFLELSKKYHPDFHTLNDEGEQEDALKMSVLNNEAYKTLKNKELLTAYILELNGITLGDNDSIPQDFLMEMMDINERLMDVQMDPNPESISAITAEIDQIRKSLLAVKFQLEQDYIVKKDKKLTLMGVKSIFLKSKYLNRLNNQLTSL